MHFVINQDTGDDIFFHSSRQGIHGPILPSSNVSRTDFGDAFYMGTKRTQALLRVTNEQAPILYELKIPKECLNQNNTLQLSKNDWLYFVLYNRGVLNDIKGTTFYEYYAHLADGKDFIVGPIADDVYDKCIKDFRDNNITDYMFKEIIDSFQYGTQIAAKSKAACDSIIIEKAYALTKEERKQALERHSMNKRQRYKYYQMRKNILSVERKGQYLSEIKERALLGNISHDVLLESEIVKQYKNLSFPRTIHGRRDSRHDLFR